ncbi:hypothetical protein F5Y19DRAFT_434251 [Xylariaceae sp. FL1651]|nr:hypothetical protein F5Y19DRAFT_434251 [Xylariaceae sp. FL1651]
MTRGPGLSSCAMFLFQLCISLQGLGSEENTCWLPLSEHTRGALASLAGPAPWGEVPAALSKGTFTPVSKLNSERQCCAEVLSTFTQRGWAGRRTMQISQKTSQR